MSKIGGFCSGVIELSGGGATSHKVGYFNRINPLAIGVSPALQAQTLTDATPLGYGLCHSKFTHV